tara:strand:- start:18 stop:554 length:537 start_codon:yes stop_codon:yes gene_type:complete
MTRHELFPTPVWHIEGTPQPLIDELYQAAYRFKEKNSSDNRSNQGGYQTPAFDWEDFHPQCKECIENTLSEHIKHPIEVMSWWYNISPKGAWNTPHNHAGVDLALVLYVTESDGLLIFMNPNSMRKIDNQFHGGAGDHVGIQAKKGDIVIFPSDLLHYVLPNPREEDRISISMNLQLS